MKRFTVILLVFVCLAFCAYIYVNRPATAFQEKSRYFFLRTDSANLPAVLEQLKGQGILKGTGVFRMLASQFNYAAKVRPGRYKITRGMSEWEVFRLLRNGRQDPVNLVINKFRTKEDFARFAGRQLECDSTDVMHILTSPDSLANYGLDSFTALTLVIPDTYQFFWNTSAGVLITRLHEEKERFWNEEREVQARTIGLVPEEVYTLASIVEEETNKHDEKPRIASVYLNRLHKGMNLGADPTVKYALRDFGLKRILYKHIDASANSPYNTYRQKGLPPGPICTPSVKSIDAVLHAEKTDYLFFCARPDFSGYHAFASNDLDHMKNARAYQAFLDSIRIK